MKRVIDAVRSQPGGRLGSALVVLILAMSVLGPALLPDGPDRLDIRGRFASPSLRHWAGTDALGRDLLSRIAAGGRVALGVSLAAIGLALPIGTLLGVAAAFAPGPAEAAILILFDIVAAFPSLLFALAAVALFGPGLGKIILLIAVTLVPHFGRVARVQALGLASAPFLEAARALGAGRTRILLRHVVPNILGPLLVLASMDIPSVITIEAGLSFLGIGVPPPRASWGTLLHDGYVHLNQSTWPVVFSCLVLILATLGFTLLGEALRGAIDPTAARLLPRGKDLATVRRSNTGGER